MIFFAPVPAWRCDPISRAAVEKIFFQAGPTALAGENDKVDPLSGAGCQLQTSPRRAMYGPDKMIRYGKFYHSSGSARRCRAHPESEKLLSR